MGIRGAAVLGGLALAAILAAPLLNASAGDARYTYANAAGSRSYLVHVPSRLSKHPALAVVLHGCGSDALTMASFTGFSAMADQKRFVVYPEQARSVAIKRAALVGTSRSGQLQPSNPKERRTLATAPTIRIMPRDPLSARSRP
jgi:poly(3-hydroxybutyrate) depolymerase